MLDSFRSKLVEKKKLAGEVYFFRFALINPCQINFIPGQYMMLRIDGKPRLYSIASSVSNKNFLEFVIEFFPGGLASEYLKKLSLNDEVLWQGPAGLFRFKDNYPESIFLATGTGIAPIRSIIHSKLKIKNSIFFLLWGLRYCDDIYFFDEFKDLEQKLNGRFKFVICLSRQKDLSMIRGEDKKYFFLGHIQDYLNKNFSEKFLKLAFYLCGNRLVVEDLKNFLQDKEVGKERVIFERF